VFKKIKLKLKKNIIWRLKSFYHLWYVYKIFNTIENKNYVLVKIHPNFPLIKFGSDFDIYTNEREKLVQLFSNFFNNKLKYKLTINNKKSGNVQLDLFYRNKFIYKFDIYCSEYNSSVFNNLFITNVIKSSVTKKFFFLSMFNIQVPNETMDAVVRIFELFSFPNKQHHRTILKKQSKEILLKAFDEISNYSVGSYKKIIQQINID